jgi:hypothetical protein
MSTHPTPDRRIAALLAQTGLAHWRATLHDLTARYAGIEDFTIGLDEGAAAELIGLLRQLAKSEKGISDEAFALAVADLGILDYRVCHVRDGHMDAHDCWQPNRETLAAFRARGTATAYPDPNRREPLGLTARRLLNRLRHNGHG